jgi:hypothetical protein
LLFDASGVCIGDGGETVLESCSGIQEDVDVDLKASVINAIHIVSCETNIGACSTDAHSVPPFLFSIKLKDHEAREIPHDMMSTVGHPVGSLCTHSVYSGTKLSEREEVLLTKLGNYRDQEAVIRELNEASVNNNGTLKCSNYLMMLANERVGGSVPLSETSPYRINHRGSIPGTEIKYLMQAFDKNIQEVQKMFYNMSDIYGYLSLTHNESICEPFNKGSINVLVRVIIRIDLRASCK